MTAACDTVSWRVTPSLRIATFSHLNQRGEDVLVDSDMKTKLCRHGETGSTIRTWLQAEARALAHGEPPPPRSSACDCQSTHGLKNGTRTRPPTPPASLYDALASDCSEPRCIEVQDESVLAYALPGSETAFLAPDGALYCANGRPMRRPRQGRQVQRACAYRVKSDRKESALCDCRLLLPKRVARVEFAACGLVR